MSGVAMQQVGPRRGKDLGRAQRHYGKMRAEEWRKRNAKGSEDLDKSAETEEVSHMYDEAT